MSGEEKPWRDEDRLRELYIDKGMSSTEVAEELGCSQATIPRWLKRYDIPIQKPYNDLTRPASFFTHKRGYERWATEYDGEAWHIPVHKLVAIADGADPSKMFSNSEYSVHHKNEIPWDNRPENIQVVSTSEHHKIHWEARHGERPWRDKEKFKEAYETRSVPELAEYWGCGDSTVSQWRAEHGIPPHKSYDLTHE